MDTNNVILVGKPIYYRAYGYGFSNQKMVSSWSKELSKIESLIDGQNGYNGSKLLKKIEKTKNISSLGGSNIEAKEKDILRIEKLLKKVKSTELKSNLMEQLGILYNDVEILKNYSELRILNISGFLKEYKTF